MDHCIGSLQETQAFTALDASWKYLQPSSKDAVKEKDTFTSILGAYHYTCMHLGLRNAPGMFQRAFEMILFGVLRKSCLVYRDEVIFSKNSRQHDKDIEKVLILLCLAGVTLKTTQVPFLSEAN